MRALASYRPNDPSRPTVCLVHGLNSSSGGFVHMIPWLEEAGYGIVIYDYPFNRPIEESCAAFARDWAAFREKSGDQLSWAILAHSMGALLARSLVEDDATWARRRLVADPDRAGESRVAPGPGADGDPAHERPAIDQREEDLEGDDAPLRRDGPGRAGHAAGQRVPGEAEPAPASAGYCLPHRGGRQRLPHPRRPRADRGPGRTGESQRRHLRPASPRRRPPTCPSCSTS